MLIKKLFSNFAFLGVFIVLITVSLLVLTKMLISVSPQPDYNIPTLVSVTDNSVSLVNIGKDKENRDTLFSTDKDSRIFGSTKVKDFIIFGQVNQKNENSINSLNLNTGKVETLLNKDGVNYTSPSYLTDTSFTYTTIDKVEEVEHNHSESDEHEGHEHKESTKIHQTVYVFDLISMTSSVLELPIPNDSNLVNIRANESGTTLLFGIRNIDAHHGDNVFAYDLKSQEHKEIGVGEINGNYGWLDDNNIYYSSSGKVQRYSLKDSKTETILALNDTSSIITLLNDSDGKYYSTVTGFIDSSNPNIFYQSIIEIENTEYSILNNIVSDNYGFASDQLLQLNENTFLVEVVDGADNKDAVLVDRKTGNSFISFPSTKTFIFN